MTRKRIQKYSCSPRTGCDLREWLLLEEAVHRLKTAIEHVINMFTVVQRTGGRLREKLVPPTTTAFTLQMRHVVLESD